MLSKKHHRLAASFIMSVIMVFLMTLVITIVNTGIEGDFAARWWKAMYIAWPIAFVIILIIAKPVQQVAAKICSIEPASNA